MKKQLLLIVLLLWVYNMHAQQINTSSGSTQKNEFSAEWIIGGSLTDNSVFSGFEETTGFEIEVASIDLIEVHPTATRDILKINCKDEFKANINYLIFNSLGIDIISGSIYDKTPFYLDVNQIPAGHYVLHFYSPDDKTFIVTVKFIKL